MIGMRCGFSVAVLASLTVCAVAADKPSAGAKSNAAFSAAKKTFHSKAKSKVPQDRIDGVALLADFPTEDSVELMWYAGLKDAVPAVRLANVRQLASWTDKPGVARWTLNKLSHVAKKNGIDVSSLSAVHALACSEDEELRGSVLLFLDTWLGTPQADQRLIHTWIDELGTDVDPVTVRALRLLTKTKMYTAHFGYRRCVVQAVTHIKGNESLSLLIDLLGDLQGIIQYDIIVHLTRETGESFKADVDLWRAWWFKNKGNAPKPDKNQPPGDIYGPLPKYYGLPITARRAVFVMDVSGSMRGPPLAAAKAQLIEAIKGLPEEVYFGVVAFNNKVRVLRSELMRATDENKAWACVAVQAQEASGETASYDALEAAFALDPEAIYFLSDGAPKGGKIADPVQIVNAMCYQNHVRRVSIHSLGIGIKSKTAFASFMRTLAEPNWGEYQEVP